MSNEFGQEATPQQTSRRTFLTGLGLAGAVGAATGLGLFRAPQASAAAPSQYTASWASVDQHPPAPDWYQDAKFGIFYHWGAFSVPQYGTEWYPRRMYDRNDDCYTHHVATYGDPAAWPYNNFIDGARDKAGNFVQFNPKLKSAGGNFDPAAWASLFVAAGAKFAGPVAEHHDGYSMWDSKVNEWNSVQRGPKLNLVKLHVDAIRAKGMKVVVAMHHAYNYNGYFEFAPAQSNASLQKLYGQLPRATENQLWYDKLKEIVDQFSPDMLYQDFTLDRVDEQQRLNFLSYYYNQALAKKQDVVATYKDGFDLLGEVYDYERGGPADIVTPYWQTDDCISSSSWSYTIGIGYYSVAQLMHSLIDRVSKNGTVMLNIAPMPDGTIPTGQQSTLLAMGDYLGRFGESIYATRAWTVYGEGPTRMGGGAFTNPTAGTASDIRFTRTKDSKTLYATVLGYPGSTMTIATLAAGRFDISTLQSTQLLSNTAGQYIALAKPTQNASGLRVTLPANAPFSAVAYVVKLTFSGQIPTLTSGTGGTGGTGSATATTVYTDVAYTGSTAALAIGRYTSAQLQQRGIPAASISSLRIPAGFQLVGYAGDNFAGTAWTFTADSGDLRPSGNNDAIRSLEVQFAPARYFQLANVTNGLAIDSGGSVAAGSSLKQWTFDGSPNLQWQAVPVGGGYYKLVNRANGFVVDGTGATAAGAAVKENPFAATNNNQQWTITDTGSATYTIQNRATGLVLDSGGQVPSGSPLKQWTAVSSPNLQFRFILQP